ncbi:hypothetical protein AURDEDRAFT_114164 [Auricularia subglabra TFB-10046 SS5]|nr:hypothetical protein AURDEDRAFT_114164 [Auricularia subglabra TFB-10046 SS5]
MLCFCPVVSAWSCCFGLLLSLAGLATPANINSHIFFAGSSKHNPVLPISGLMVPTTAWHVSSGLSFTR